jgi:hypothetical protein
MQVIDAQLDYNIFFGRNYMYVLKAVASFVFHMMMFPHNGKIVTIDQLTHYEPNHSDNIDNTLPLVRVSSDDFPVFNIGPGLFQDPSMLGTYQGVPPFLNPSFSAQVCVVSSKGTNIGDKTPITDSPPHIKVQPVEEILPEEFPKSTTTPLITYLPPLQGKIPVWETVHQAIPQIPFLYPPPVVESFHVARTLTLPNMVLAIPVWYLHPPEMVPQPSLPPQSERISMQIPVLTLATSPSPSIANTIATDGGRQMKKETIAPLPP